MVAWHDDQSQVLIRAQHVMMSTDRLTCCDSNMTRDDIWTRYAPPALMAGLLGLPAAGNALAVVRVLSGDPFGLISLLLPIALTGGLWQSRQDTHCPTSIVLGVLLCWSGGGLVGAACWWALPSLHGWIA